MAYGGHGEDQAAVMAQIAAAAMACTGVTGDRGVQPDLGLV
jgi:hypothetical protein